jgi:tRNA (guanine-N7-)-methyltransferase
VSSHRLPHAKSSAFWAAIFHNDNPVEVEVGAGGGAFLLQASADHPERNYFGIEHARSRVRLLEEKLEASPRSNVVVIGADAAFVVRRLIPPQSIAVFHIYFPDPWWKRRHHRRRLFTEGFVHDLARALAPGGELRAATDVPDVADLIRTTVAVTGLFAETDAAQSLRQKPTAFERKGVARGAKIEEISFRKIS